MTLKLTLAKRLQLCILLALGMSLASLSGPTCRRQQQSSQALWPELWPMSLLLIPVPAPVVWGIKWNPVVYLGPYCQPPAKTRNIPSHSVSILMPQGSLSGRLEWGLLPSQAFWNDCRSCRWEHGAVASPLVLACGVTFAVWGPYPLAKNAEWKKPVAPVVGSRARLSIAQQCTQRSKSAVIHSQTLSETHVQIRTNRLSPEWHTQSYCLSSRTFCFLFLSKNVFVRVLCPVCLFGFCFTLALSFALIWSSPQQGRAHKQLGVACINIFLGS